MPIERGQVFWHEPAIIWHILRPCVPKDLGHLFIAHHSSYTHGAHAREICQIDYML